MQGNLFSGESQYSRFMASLRAGEVDSCPCCKRYAQLYRRTITSTMAKQLVEFARAGGLETWQHTAKVVSGRSGAGDFAKLRYWGIIEPKSHSPGDDGKKASGFWRITETGRLFLSGQVRLPQFKLVFDDCVLATSTETAAFTECLGQHFDYNTIFNTKGN